MSLTYLGVTAILSSIRRVILEEKAGKEIPASARLEFLKKISVKHYSFVRYRRQHFSAIQSKRDSRFVKFVKGQVFEKRKTFVLLV